MVYYNSLVIVYYDRLGLSRGKIIILKKGYYNFAGFRQLVVFRKLLKELLIGSGEGRNEQILSFIGWLKDHER